MSNTHLKNLETFDSLSDDLGDELEVELPEGFVVHGLEITVKKGSLSGETDGYNNPDLIRDVLANVKTSIGGNDFTDVDGEALAAYHIANNFSTPQDSNSPSGAGRQGIMDIPMADPVPVSEFNEHKVELDLRAIGDISDATGQSDTKVEVAARVSKSGNMEEFSKLRRINKNFNSTGQERDTFELTGNLNRLVVNLDSADLDELEVNGVRQGASDINLVEVTKTQLRQETRKKLPGNVDLPDGYYIIELPRGGIEYSELEFLELLPNITSTGDIEFFPTTVQKLQNPRRA